MLFIFNNIQLLIFLIFCSLPWFPFCLSYSRTKIRLKPHLKWDADPFWSCIMRRSKKNRNGLISAPPAAVVEVHIEPAAGGFESAEHQQPSQCARAAPGSARAAADSPRGGLRSGPVAAGWSATSPPAMASAQPPGRIPEWVQKPPLSTVGLLSPPDKWS